MPDDQAHGPYGEFVHDLARWARAHLIGRLKESSVLSDRAKLIDGAVSLAGIASADWYLTTEIASGGDGGGSGLARLMRRRAEAGLHPTEEEFLIVALVCTFFYLFAVMADRDRLSAARTFVAEVGAPTELGDMARELERVYPTRRVSPRPTATLTAYLAHADQLLGRHLGVDNRPGLSESQAARVLQQFTSLYLKNVLPVVQQLS